MNIKPLGDNVVVKQAAAEETTASGLVLPNRDEKKNEGVVVAVGPGKTVNGVFVATTLKVGDKVLLKQWGGDVVKTGGEEYKILPEGDIPALLE